MATLIDAGDRVFLDTSYAVALAVRNDALHAQARLLRAELQLAKARFITTRAVLLEIGNALSALQHRAGTGKLLSALEHDRRMAIMPLNEELYRKALDLFGSRLDQEWGLVDCASFVVMQEAGIRKALTADHHFQQAGFEVLLAHD